MGAKADGFRARHDHHCAPVRPRLRRRLHRAARQQGRQVPGRDLTVTATSREQLDELYRTLSTHPMVKVVL
jgi:hypothetical protein